MPFPRLLVLVAALQFGAGAGVCAAQEDDARQRQAAAEAYDRGTAAYLGGEYAKAAEWFETAHRMSPAAPALMQAIRSHRRADQETRAATLALRLMQEYPEETAASEYGQSVLSELSDQFFRVDVVCDCRLDLDDTLQEFHSFFLTPDTPHTITAHFDTGKKTEDVSGAAGENRTLRFEAPPPPPEVATEVPGEPVTDTPHDPAARPAADDDGGKPFAPVVAFVGIGLTAAVGGGAFASLIDRNAKVNDYEDAANESNACAVDPSCSADMRTELRDAAEGKRDDAKSADTRTLILGIATGVVGVGTAAIALFLTDWGGGDDGESGRISFDLASTPNASVGTVTVRW